MAILTMTVAATIKPLASAVSKLLNMTGNAIAKILVKEKKVTKPIAASSKT